MTSPSNSSRPLSSPPLSTPPARATPLARFGPLGLVIAAIVVVGILASTGGTSTKDELAATGNGTTTTPGGTGGTAPPAGPKVPIQYDAAKKAGTLAKYDWGDGCDPKTGRIKLPDVYAPPCVPAFHGANGGATSPGVTATEIKVVAYTAQGSDLAAALQGLSDPIDAQARTRQKYLDMLNDVMETYGRTVKLVVFKTSADGADAAAAKADAVKVAEEIKPFASLGGPGLTPAYVDELARHQILCFACGISLPDAAYQRNAPYMWGSQPSPEQYLVGLTEFVGKQLFKKKATFAGPQFTNTTRVFGVVHFEQDPPVFNGVTADLDEKNKGTGYETKVSETYILDVPKLGERAATIIAKMKSAGVTTVIFLGDPIMPTYLTKEATAQDYFPEWVFTGTVLTDTTVFGRQYDPAQMAHAFGISNLPVRSPREKSEAFTLYKWYFGGQPEASNTAALIYPTLQLLMLGIHTAGPDLTPETFRDGMFAVAPSGGGPTVPHISFGQHGYFPKPDYLAIDDLTLIWWDATDTGPDEQGKTAATGSWRHVDGGKRYLTGQIPTVGKLFVKAGSVVAYDTPPGSDAAPSYPSPTRPGG